MATDKAEKVSSSGYETSIPRCVVAGVLAVAGIAWLVVYYVVARDAATFIEFPGAEKPADPIPWMADLKLWNYLIGFGLLLAGLIAAAHRKTPLGRGRGVVIGMLGCFLFGLIWIVVFYFINATTVQVPIMSDLGQYNLVLGMVVMAVGFSFATKWE